MIFDGYTIILSPDATATPLPGPRPANWAATRTCPACGVDWSSTEACWVCGAEGTALSYLPAARQAEHRFSGQAVLTPSTTTESSPT